MFEYGVMKMHISYWTLFTGTIQYNDNFNIANLVLTTYLLL